MLIPTLAWWEHDFSPFALQFTEGFGIRWYGLAYVCAFLSAAWLLVRYAKYQRSLLPAGKVADLMTALVLGVLLGGRIGHYFLYGAYTSFTSDPFALVRVWQGGMSFHGGLVGVVLAVLWFSRTHKLPSLHLGDLVASVTPLGLFYGRIANFINGELWGKPSEVSWAVIFPQSFVTGTLVPRHPSQLYEAVLEGLVLCAWLQWRVWRSNLPLLTPGRLTAEFLFLYALSRILCEQFREPDADVSLIPVLGMSLSRGVVYSLVMLLGAVWLFWLSRRRALQHPRCQS